MPGTHYNQALNFKDKESFEKARAIIEGREEGHEKAVQDMVEFLTGDETNEQGPNTWAINTLNDKAVRDVRKESTRGAYGHLHDSNYEVLSDVLISKPSPVFSVREQKISTPKGVITRQYVHHAEAVSVGIYRKNGDNYDVLVTEEYRTGSGRVTKASVAGLVNDGEHPDAALAREVKEESGIVLDPDATTYLAGIISSEGFTDEFVYIYGAEVPTDTTFGEQALDDDEYLKVHWESLTTLLQEFKRGEILSAPTIIFLKWLQGKAKKGE